MTLRIRAGDTVVLRSGAEKGKTGKVLRVDPDRSRVFVEGINLQYRHVRRSQQNPKGGRIRREGPIHISKVQLWSDSQKKGQRFRVEVQGSKKVRVGAVDGQTVS